MTSLKDNRKYNSDVSDDKTVRISNRYDLLSDDYEDSNEINDVEKENIIDWNKRKEKKMIKGLQKQVNIENKTPRQNCKKSFQKKYEEDMISIQSSGNSNSDSSLDSISESSYNKESDICD